MRFVSFTSFLRDTKNRANWRFEFGYTFVPGKTCTKNWTTKGENISTNENKFKNNNKRILFVLTDFCSIYFLALSRVYYNYYLFGIN